MAKKEFRRTFMWYQQFKNLQLAGSIGNSYKNQLFFFIKALFKQNSIR